MPDTPPRRRRAGAVRNAAALLAALFCTGVAAADVPAPFEARFDVFRNGKLQASTEIRFDATGESWVMRTETRGTKGLARMLGARESSVSRGDWVDGKPRPERFERTVDTRVWDESASAQFDWSAGTVHSVYREGEQTLELSPGVVDGASEALAIRAGLVAGEEEWSLQVVDEDEIEVHRYRAAPPQRRDTPLGCLEVRVVERLRGPESRRYTNTWYATELGFAPVFVEHGKGDEERVETRIKALTVDGQPVSPRPKCQ